MLSIQAASMQVIAPNWLNQKHLIDGHNRSSGLSQGLHFLAITLGSFTGPGFERANE
jgi:hypothetical protein